MIIQVWVISVITMIIFLILGFKISPKEVLFSMFPNTFANNWYITCYLLLYIILLFLIKYHEASLYRFTSHHRRVPAMSRPPSSVTAFCVFSLLLVYSVVGNFRRLIISPFVTSC